MLNGYIFKSRAEPADANPMGGETTCNALMQVIENLKKLTFVTNAGNLHKYPAQFMIRFPGMVCNISGGSN